MTAIVVAMLAIVMVAAVVLAAVGGYHHLSASPWLQRKVRRWRYVASLRLAAWREASFHRLRTLRRWTAVRLGRPVALPVARLVQRAARQG